MALNEIIRTSGDVRRCLAQTMSDIRSGDISVDKAQAIAALAKEMTASLQVEVNVAKVRIQTMDNGKALGELTHLGKMIIEDTSTPTLSGAE